jgi:hypothetical protein
MSYFSMRMRVVKGNAGDRGIESQRHRAPQMTQKVVWEVLASRGCPGHPPLVGVPRDRFQARESDGGCAGGGPVRPRC